MGGGLMSEGVMGWGVMGKELKGGRWLCGG